MCFFSSGNQDEKSEEEEMGEGKLREDRGLISPAVTAARSQTELDPPRGASRPTKRPPLALLSSLHSCNVQRVLTGRVLISQTYAQKTVLPALLPPTPNSSHISKSCHREKFCCQQGWKTAGAKGHSGGMLCFKLASGCPLPQGQ